MHRLHFGGGVTQDSGSREWVTPTRYFNNKIKHKKEDLSLT